MHQIITTPNAPKAIGPYNQAISCKPSELVFCAGQIPLDPQTMEIVGTNAKEQTEQVLKNVKAVLEAAGCSLKNVVKATIFLKNMNDFAQVNEVYGKAFAENPPARSTIEVARLPKDALVEIEVVAAK